MSSLYRMLNFYKTPFVTPRLIELGTKSIVSIPTLVFFINSFSYYADFLQSQSPDFYNNSYSEVYDFIIVGGGSAGSVVANRLSAHSSVLLLELGGDPSPLTFIPVLAGALQRCPSVDLMYETVPLIHSGKALKNNVMFWPRGTGIGGSSNLNYMIYTRGDRKDYDNWANITKNPIWAYENVLPLFMKLENYDGNYPNKTFHGTDGPLRVSKVGQTYMNAHFLKAAKEKGYKIHDTNVNSGEGFSEVDVTQYKGSRWSTYPAYIKPILKRKNLKIYRYSRVIKIHLDKNKHAYGVTYYRHGVKKFVRARYEIILSAGAIDTPKILLLSSIGPREHLHSIGLKCRVNLPVGENLQDHVTSLIGPFVFTENVNMPVYNIPRDTTLEEIVKYTSNGTGAISSIGTISSVGYVSTKGNEDKNWADIQYFQLGFGIFKGFGRALEHIFNLKNEDVESFMNKVIGRDSNLVLQVLVRPKSRGFIRLSDRDPYSKPIIQPNYYSEKEDLDAMVDGLKKLVDLYENTSSYKNIGAKLSPTPYPPCSNFSLKSDEYYRCFVSAVTFTLYHPVGTAAMGPDDYYKNIKPQISNRNHTKNKAQKNLNYMNERRKLSKSSGPVVDSKLRVYKTSGLRVVDASIMPVIVNANTNVPSIMIGEMGSILVREFWTSQSLICRWSWEPIFTPSSYRENSCTYKRIF